jgi:hypothetical protein
MKCVYTLSLGADKRTKVKNVSSRDLQLLMFYN